jgi:hypothetical protein
MNWRYRCVVLEDVAILIKKRPSVRVIGLAADVFQILIGSYPIQSIQWGGVRWPVMGMAMYGQDRARLTPIIGQ